MASGPPPSDFLPLTYQSLRRMNDYLCKNLEFETALTATMTESEATETASNWSTGVHTSQAGSVELPPRPQIHREACSKEEILIDEALAGLCLKALSDPKLKTADPFDVASWDGSPNVADSSKVETDLMKARTSKILDIKVGQEFQTAWIMLIIRQAEIKAQIDLLRNLPNMPASKGNANEQSELSHAQLKQKHIEDDAMIRELREENKKLREVITDALSKAGPKPCLFDDAEFV